MTSPPDLNPSVIPRPLVLEPDRARGPDRETCSQGAPNPHHRHPAGMAGGARPRPGPAGRSPRGATTMATAAGATAYFQRGSLFWFTVITLSFGYHTVRAPAGGPRFGKGASARSVYRRILARRPGEVVQAQSRLPRAWSRGKGRGAGMRRRRTVGCLLASEYPLSEPWAPGLFHSVFGGPPSHPPEQWVLACLADSCGRVLVCHSIVQAQRHHKWSGSATLVPTDFPVWDSVSQHLDCLQTEAPKTNLKMSESLLYTFTFMFTFFVCGG
ncbi:uncharacterized protein LOC100895927 isoform X1 [Callithrix jacchus]